MDEEIGLSADTSLVEKITDQICSNWKYSEKKPENPAVLLIGGFQGSGKATALEILKQKLDLIIISPDEIRHRLFEKGWSVSEKFVHTVNAIRNELLRKALKSGYHIAIDQLTTPARISLAKKIIEENSSNYRLFAVYLKTSEANLINRVKSRQDLQGVYKGTVRELKESMSKHGKPDLILYDLVLDTEKLTPFKTADKLAGLVALLR